MNDAALGEVLLKARFAKGQSRNGIEQRRFLVVRKELGSIHQTVRERLRCAEELGLTECVRHGSENGAGAFEAGARDIGKDQGSPASGDSSPAFKPATGNGPCTATTLPAGARPAR